jgi:iron complex outermembrane recepter protein
MRIAIAAAVTCLSIIGMTATAQVHAAIRKHTEIPAESLDIALRALAKDRGFQLVYLTENVASLQTRGAVGDFTVDEALKRLLSDSRLAYKFVDDYTVSIFPKETSTSAPGADRTPTRGSDENSSGSASKSSQFRVAQVDSGSSSRAVSVDTAASNSQSNATASGGLSEIIVTAQKKSERLQDVPVPVSVLDAEALTDNGKVLLKDYFTSIPGLSLSPNILGQTNLAIRGITTSGFNSPTVGIMVDDVPFGGTASTEVPDIDPGDLERVEVLRGPQGTLYGASSMGGLIKFVTKDPSTDSFNGRVEGGTEDVKHGAEPGFNFRGSVNVPLSDTIAIRASAFTRQDAGYIDNNALSGYQKGVNEAEAYGGRLAAMWRPSEDLIFKLSALYQRAHMDGGPEADLKLGLGDLQQDRLPDTGGYDRRIQAYSAVIDYKFGRFDLTSVSGYNVNRTLNTLDYTALLGGVINPAYPGGGGNLGVKYVNEFDASKFSQELRLATSVGPFDFLAGAFYSREVGAPGGTTSYAVDRLTGNYYRPTADTLAIPYADYILDGPVFWQRALFGDLTYRVTERFDVQIGGRYSKYTGDGGSSYNYGSLEGGGTASEGGFVSYGLPQEGHASTYLFTPRFRLSDDFMIYARLASGYRPGVANSPFTIQKGAPPNTSPDTTETYEVGAKADFFDHRVFIDTSLYYTKWKDIQITLLIDNAFSYLTNGSGAKSEGVEFSVTAKPLTGLTISSWVDYDNAVLTKDFGSNSPSYGVVGDRLPLGAKFTANLSLEQNVRLTDELTGFVGGEMSYVGDRYGQFLGFADSPANTIPAPRQRFPSYAQLDLLAGVKHDQWKASMYVHNVADKRGILNGGPADLYNPYAFLFIQPRTVGLSLSRTF